MKIILDASFLVRAPANPQHPVSRELLSDAQLVAIPLVALCAACETLQRDKAQDRSDIVSAIESLIARPNVEVERDAVRAGLLTLISGGDFLDGVVDYEGRLLGGRTRISAVGHLQDIGDDIVLPS